MTYEKALSTLMNLTKDKEKKYKKKLISIKKFLIECNNAFYTSNEIIINNTEFDILLKEYNETLKRLKLLNKEKYKVTTSLFNDEKLNHQVLNLLGTLEKVNNIDEINKWVNSKIAEVDSNFVILVSLKYDGNSVCITYDKDGKIINATTRGKNGLGENVTNIFKNHSIYNPIGEEIAIKYEVITTDENYEHLLNNSEIKYANNRSVVSAILHRKDGDKFAKFLSLVPLEIRYLNETKKIKRYDQLKFIDEIVLKTGQPLFQFKYKILEDFDDEELISMKKQLKELEKFYNKINSSERLNLENFMFDGLVIEILDDDIRENLGYSDDLPNFSVAAKFDYLEAETKVIDVRFDYGRSGRITPVIQYEPIEFFGNVQQFTSISNYKRFNELKLRKGDIVRIQYRNYCDSY